ncbi:MAG: hypothetical protein M5U11_09705 [Anaerolineales bacterium]|jgi:hypothetical protein|nr:hypothetical protein [Anaerolineales bacterium]MCZ7549403.1 hypothetical protein [Anaerolineales bacterium]MDX9938192.1 hypothetical protein [Anaerolineales bacterium]OQY83054.1 MAG: hypothetical protein B6D40_07740 [Anaerolineae bacterium UTCFX3]GER80718.1 conserved hypothetical protein [Candidatus Denitrolinea symbiosum]
MPKLTRAELQELLQAAVQSQPHRLCPTCELFLTYIAHLRRDSDSADNDLFAPLKVPYKDMHKFIGCRPCPPGLLYTEYIKRKQKSISNETDLRG